MKKSLIFFIFAALCVFLSCISVRDAFAEDVSDEIVRLVASRRSVCWFEGNLIGDIVVNARGKISFLYIDSKLASAFSRQKKNDMKNGPSSNVPGEFISYSAKYNARKKHVLFVASVKALKGWDFNTDKLSAGGYSPAKDDIIKGVTSGTTLELRHGERFLQKNYEGYIGFFVPADSVKPGTTVKIGYGADLVDWTVPVK